MLSSDVVVKTAFDTVMTVFVLFSNAITQVVRGEK